MIALLTWIDGFGHDTEVKGIFPTLEEAKRYAEKGDKYTEFDFGLVNFEIYEANDIYPTKKKKKR